MKTIVCIFAHPDDEALFIGGTLAKLARENDVYIICATDGDWDGRNHDKKIGDVRKKELIKSAEILGIKDVYFLGFQDGTLSNNLYHKVAESIRDRLNDLKPDTLITFEPNGVTGHIDHLFISKVTTYLFDKLPYIKEIWYGCYSVDMAKYFKDYFIYFPEGYKQSEVDEIIDVSDVWDIKISAINQHQSQINDVKRVLNALQKTKKEEYFLIKKKN